MKIKSFVLLLIAILLTGCTKLVEYDNPEGEVADMSGYNQLESQQFYQISIKDVLELFNSDKTTIVYLGYETCEWCNSFIPIFNEVSIEKEMKVYYMDFHNEENFNDIESFKALLDLMDEKGLAKYNENGDIAVFFPTVLYIREGELFNTHIGTVSGHNAQQDPLTEKQAARLKYQLEKEFDELISIEI